jgi:diguanylate cyclase
MKAWRWPAVVFGMLILISIWVFLYYQTQIFNIERQNQIFLDLRVLKQMDVEWSTNILRSRIGMNNNYDPLSLPVHSMQQLQGNLHQALEQTRLQTANTSLARFGLAFAEKKELVERFKSQNAILRNSLIYFPLAVEELKQQLRELERTRPAQALEMASLEAQTSTLMADTLRFNLVPDAQLASQIKARLVQLEARAWPPRIHAMLVQLSAHIHVILRQRVLEDALLLRLGAINSERIIDDVIYACEQEFAWAVAEKRRYRSLLLGYAGLLVLLAGYVLLQIVKKYRMNVPGKPHLPAGDEPSSRQRTVELEPPAHLLGEMLAYDSLTGLANRALLMRQLERALARAERRTSVVVLMYISLDGLQTVRDNCGVAVGDAVLQAVAHRVPRNFRDEDCFARLNGGEFVILLEDVATRDGALRVAQEVLWQIEQISAVAEHSIRLSACIGISCAQGRFGVTDAAAVLVDEARHAMPETEQGIRIAFAANARWGMAG